MSICNACAMADNNAENNPDRVRLENVSQTAPVRRERVAPRTIRSQVNDNSFDGSQSSSSQRLGSSSRNLLSQASTSRGHESLNDAINPEVPKGRKEATGPLKSYSGGPFDTPLLHLYTYHVVRHIWEGEVYFFLLQYICF